MLFMSFKAIKYFLQLYLLFFCVKFAGRAFREQAPFEGRPVQRPQREEEPWDVGSSIVQDDGPRI